MANRADSDGDMSVGDILNAIRRRVSDETGARYARDTEIVRREMLVLQPEARIDTALAEAQGGDDPTRSSPREKKTKRPKADSDVTLNARILAIIIDELEKPESPLRTALRDALNAELGGG